MRITSIEPYNDGTRYVLDFHGRVIECLEDSDGNRSCWYRDTEEEPPKDVRQRVLHAVRRRIRVTIDRDGIWCGEGRWVDNEIVDCAAILGDDQEASDETYQAIEDALSSLDQSDEHWRGPVSVTRPDGVYTAELDDSLE